jgi:hypothetical protein
MNLNPTLDEALLLQKCNIIAILLSLPVLFARNSTQTKALTSLELGMVDL